MGFRLGEVRVWCPDPFADVLRKGVTMLLFFPEKKREHAYEIQRWFGCEPSRVVQKQEMEQN